jgi:hypothetical protein
MGSGYIVVLNKQSSSQGGTGLEARTTAVVALFQVGAVRPDFEWTCSPTLSSGSAGVRVANSTA